MKNAKVAIRNIRRDAMDEAKKQEKAKEITEDELKTLEKIFKKRQTMLLNTSTI